ncbi:hypothetical protein Sango_1269300 [Sesamum angolense]|uniref:DUF4378 domain-containing protein n=1 Tax=Sesamum angolense TaxID=2727404 RepID=A0AAE2BUD2_9LAMI|nr:hypothetical protein Sango_1269300 [Sesamum angolense]
MKKLLGTRNSCKRREPKIKAVAELQRRRSFVRFFFAEILAAVWEFLGGLFLPFPLQNFSHFFKQEFIDLMKDCQKRWKPNNTDSVIATLMGFDELRPQQPSHEKCRVLSETYVWKAASVGARPGSLISVGRRNKEIVYGAKGVAGLQTSKFKNDNVLDINSGDTKVKTDIRSPEPAGNSVSDSLSGASYDDRRSFGKGVEHCARGNVLRYLQKLEHDSLGGQLGELGIDYTNESFKFPPEMIDKPWLFPTRTSAFKHESEKVPYNLADVKLDRRSRSGYREKRELRHESQKHHHELTYKELSVNGQSYLPNESKRQNFERSKTEKVVQEIGISRKGGTLNQVLALADKKSMQRNLNVRLGRNGLHSLSSMQSTNSSSSSPSGCSSIDVWEDDCIKSLPVFEFEAIKQPFQEAVTIVLRMIESNPGVLSAEGGHSSYVEEVSSREPSLTDFSEEESSYSNSSRIGPPEFRDTLKKTNQHSPNSVLEPFNAQYSCAFQCLDGIDLKLQLEALNFETEETYSGESVMAVSDDDVSEEHFDEAGFCGMKSLDLETWHSLECPISPSVFEALEKKYGKQTSWQKTERRLLFDRINSGLMVIFNPVVNFHPCAASIRRNLCSSFRRDDVEDELWKMLISQEKETSKNLSNKALEKWIQLEEEETDSCKYKISHYRNAYTKSGQGSIVSSIQGMLC